jgi:hypothetical protein
VPPALFLLRFRPLVMWSATLVDSFLMLWLARMRCSCGTQAEGVCGGRGGQRGSKQSVSGGAAVATEKLDDQPQPSPLSHSFSPADCTPVNLSGIGFRNLCVVHMHVCKLPNKHICCRRPYLDEADAQVLPAVSA